MLHLNSSVMHRSFLVYSTVLDFFCFGIFAHFELMRNYRSYYRSYYFRQTENSKNIWWWKNWDWPQWGKENGINGTFTPIGSVPDGLEPADWGFFIFLPIFVHKNVPIRIWLKILPDFRGFTFKNSTQGSAKRKKLSISRWERYKASRLESPVAFLINWLTR